MAKNAPKPAPAATTEEAPAPVKLAKAELVALFNVAAKADAALAAANKVVEESMAARSKAVEAICNGSGGSKGPFKTPDGRLVTIRTRSLKDADKNVIGATWFFVGQGDSEIIDLS